MRFRKDEDALKTRDTMVPFWDLYESPEAESSSEY
jgi:hypothetical protein